MRFKHIVLLIIVAGLAIRALVDYYDAYHNTKHVVYGAVEGTKDCQKIYENVKFSSELLRSKIIGVCEEEAKMGSRWIIFESMKAWLAGLWFCDNLHCSEYVFPVLDQLGNAFRYSIFVSIAVLFLTLYYMIPALLSALFERLRPAPPPGYCPPCAIDMSPYSNHRMYALPIENSK